MRKNSILKKFDFITAVVMITGTMAAVKLQGLVARMYSRAIDIVAVEGEYGTNKDLQFNEIDVVDPIRLTSTYNIYDDMI
jgi:predicted membrane channel-forming protein YqfA (hemolysin III family)